jgi:5-methylcytosine-specific restriction enzyme A
MPMPEQPPGVRRRRLDDKSPCSEYEIYRVSDGAVLGHTKRANQGWLVQAANSSQWVLSRGDAPHTSAMFWLSGSADFDVADGILTGHASSGPESGDGSSADSAPSPPHSVPTFILTWNPTIYGWDELEAGYDQAIQVTAGGQPWYEDWTVGVRTGGISPGDRAYLLRQHQDRGLIGSGTFTSPVRSGPHWDGSGRSAHLADIAWDTILHHQDRLSVEQLKAQIPEVPWDHIQGSGISVSKTAADALRELWATHSNEILFRSPDEPIEPSPTLYPEGALSQVQINRYERDPKARKECLEAKGYDCVVCGFSFEERYGPLGRSYIHVHHVIELSKAPPDYKVSPLEDLVPVCPNCHAMIHRGTGQALTVEELKQQLWQQQQSLG